MSQPQKVPLYSLNDLKNATDDALAPYLTSLPAPYKFKQSHFYTDIRLALGSAAVAISGALFYADYKLGWDSTKNWTGIACVAYFILNGLLTYWSWKVEAGKVFVGTREGGQKLTLSSSVDKHKPIYKLHVQYGAPSGKQWEDKTIEGPFSNWFSTDGYLQQPQFKSWLATNIETIGLADPSRVTSTSNTVSDETVVVANDLSDSVAAQTPSGSIKARKGKKKA